MQSFQAVLHEDWTHTIRWTMAEFSGARTNPMDIKSTNSIHCRKSIGYISESCAKSVSRGFIKCYEGRHYGSDHEAERGSKHLDLSHPRGSSHARATRSMHSPSSSRKHYTTQLVQDHIRLSYRQVRSTGNYRVGTYNETITYQPDLTSSGW